MKHSQPFDNVLLFFKFYDPTVEDVEERVKLVHVQVRELHYIMFTFRVETLMYTAL